MFINHSQMSTPRLTGAYSKSEDFVGEFIFSGGLRKKSAIMQWRLRPVTGGCVMTAKLAGCPCSQGGWKRE